MISELLLSSRRPPQPDSLLLIHEDRRVTWGDLIDEATRLETAYADWRNQRVALSFPASRWGFASVAALDRLGCDIVLIDSRLTRETAEQLTRSFPVDVLLHSSDPDGYGAWEPVFRDSPSGRRSGQGQVTLLTSGTTGIPKAVSHTWQSLFRPVRKTPPDLRGGTWLLSYRPHLYAGLQVILQAIAWQDPIAVAHAAASPPEIAHLMADAQVHYASATPAYWRQLLVFADREILKRIPLRQITLGGEVVDQLILDQLRATYPQATISHIYATTELGRCFSVRDGRAGFPKEFLTKCTSDGVRLRIVENELQVQSANAMVGYLSSLSQPVENPTEHHESTWISTGDLVEITDDRVRFIGRRSDLINVGGNKVAPASVEDVLRGIQDVNDVRVYGKPSSLAGQIVACQIIPREGVDRDALRQRIAQTCRASLASAQVPRWIEFVDRIELNASGKVSRQS